MVAVKWESPVREVVSAEIQAAITLQLATGQTKCEERMKLLDVVLHVHNTLSIDLQTF
jgi:hypothetical protein